MTNPITTLRGMTRPSSNGHEISVAMVHHTKTYYSWDVVRYPLDPHDTTPTETIVDGTGLTWSEIAARVRDYLTGHPEDGFWFI